MAVFAVAEAGTQSLTEACLLSQLGGAVVLGIAKAALYVYVLRHRMELVPVMVASLLAVNVVIVALRHYLSLDLPPLALLWGGAAAGAVPLLLSTLLGALLTVMLSGSAALVLFYALLPRTLSATTTTTPE